METDSLVKFFNRGNKLYKGKLYEEALEEYKKAAKEDLTAFNAHFCVAKTLVRLYRTQEAVEYFKKYFHLIPEQKRNNYVIGLARILLEENSSTLALGLINDYYKLNYTEKQILFIIELNFINSKISEGIEKTLNLPVKHSTLKTYESLLENKQIPKDTIKKLKNDNIIPRFYKHYKSVKLLDNASISNNSLNKIIISLKNQIREMRNKKGVNYTESLEKIQDLLTACHDIMEKMLQNNLRARETYKAKTVLGLLLSTGFDKKKLDIPKKEIESQGKTKKAKLFKTLGISISAILIFGILSIIGYNYFNKSNDKSEAIKRNTISSYTKYLNKYGDDKEINNLLEDQIYKVSISTNDAKYFNLLSSKFPKSNKIKTISISKSGNASLNVSGIGSNVKLKGKNDKYKVPIGGKIVYRIYEKNKVPIKKYVTVYDDMVIDEKLIDSKELLLYDSFDSNRNGWNTFETSKQIWSRTKYKGIKISDGNLQLYHEFSDNKFVYSTIPVANMNKDEDFIIETSISRNGIDAGTYLLFGFGNRAFNYVGISKRGTYDYGYNNWGNTADKWVSLSKGWRGSNAVYRGSYPTHKLKLIKHNDNINISINGKFIGNMPLKRWYGNKVGFGINDNTKSNINDVMVYKKVNRYPIAFKKNRVYYCWLDELNVRDTSSIDGSIITTIKKGDPVLYLGEKGDVLRKTTFKGIYSPDYYYKVKLTNGTIGWVHGGAFKRIDNQNKSDLDLWKLISKKG